MGNLPKKIISLFIITLLVSLIIWSKEVSAQIPADIFHDQTITAKDQQEKDAQQKETAGQGLQVFSTRVNENQLGDTMYNLCNMVIDCTGDPKLRANQPTALGSIAKLMDTLYANPPASGLAYVRYTLENAGFVPEAHAQGIGFAGLSPLIPFWRASRNIAYSLIIIIMVAVGFMVIFRMKIDPKTVISVQAALPKIVLTLIVITFSYPIAGFLVDLMYLIMAIGIKIVVDGMGGTVGFVGADAVRLQTAYLNAGLGELFSAVFWAATAPVQTGIALYPAVGSVITILIGHFAAAGGLFAFLPALIFILIVALGLLFTFLRLFLLLLNSYIQLLIAVVLGPIVLLGEAIPGRSAFKDWILNIMANLVVFPATALIILFSVYMSSQQQQAFSWAPPFIGIAGAGELFHLILGVGIIFMSPQLVVSIKKIFHPKPALPISAATPFAPIIGGAQTVMGAGTQFYYTSQLFGSEQHPGPLYKAVSLFRGGPRKS